VRLPSERLGACQLTSGTSTIRYRCTTGQYNPFGEWNLQVRRRHRAHCWVLKDQATDSSDREVSNGRRTSVREGLFLPGPPVA
jgi:hypothetical protein